MLLVCHSVETRFVLAKSLAPLRGTCGAGPFSIRTSRFRTTLTRVCRGCNYSYYLVGALEHEVNYFPVGNFIIPTDELHHFSEG